MALKINVPLTDRNGLTIPSGAVVRMGVIFPATGLSMHYNLDVYRSISSFDGSDNPIEAKVYPQELDGNFGVVRNLTAQELIDITLPEGQNWMKDYLEAIPAIGVGNVEII